MPAQILINQAGLPAGTAGEARTDGLDTGALVTLSSTGGGNTHTFRFLWVPDEDTTAVASLAPTGTPSIWTFSPTADVYGSYRIELIVDEGLPTESRSIRTFGIRLSRSGLLIPALNERCDPTATLVNNGPDQIESSENNEPIAGGPFALGSYGGWYPAIKALIESVESGGGAPLFKWNEADFTQFGSNLLAPVAGTVVPSVVTNAKSNRIRFTMTGYQGRACFPVTGLVLPRRFVVRMRVDLQTGGFTGSDGFACYIHNNLTDANFFAFEWFRSTNTASSSFGCIELGGPGFGGAASFAALNATTFPTTEGGNVEIVHVQDASPSFGPTPLCNFQLSEWGSSHGGEMAYDTQLTFTEDWETISINSFGIGLDYSNVQNGTFEISELAVYPHPLDL